MFETIQQKLRGRAQAAELYSMESWSTPVIFKANQIHSIETVQMTGYGLRCISGGRLGFSSTNRKDLMESLADHALESARFGEESRFEFPRSGQGPCVQILDPAVSEFTIDRAMETGSEIISILGKTCPKLITDVAIEWGERRVRVQNTNGGDFSDHKSVFSIFISSNQVDDNGILWVDEGHAGCALNTEVQSLIGQLRRRVEQASRLRKPDGREQVLFLPQALPALLAGFQAALNGKTVYKGSSPLKGREGERLLDSRLSFEDDPTRAFMSNTYSRDDEGVPAASRFLVENGVLRSFIFDLQTAGLMNTRSTGNGQRGYGSVPSPEFSNFVVSAGDHTTEEIIRNIRNGLVVVSVLGGGQSNLLAGDFSLNLNLAYKIENGEITGRVKDTMISGNIYTVFNPVSAISSDRRREGALLLPAILLEGIRISC